jgi:renal tumor antigen
VHKIHNIVGTPDDNLLKKFQKYATHMEFNFPSTEGSGIAKLIPHASRDLQDLICKMLIYNPDNRISASLSLKHPWFKEIREQEQMLS